MASGRSTRPADLQEQENGQPPGTTDADRAHRTARLADPDDKPAAGELDLTQPAAPPTRPSRPSPAAVAAAADNATAQARAEAELAAIDAQVQQLANLTAWPRARKEAEQRLVDARNGEQLSLLLVQAKAQHDAGGKVDPDVIHRLAAQLARWATGRNIEAA